MSSRCPHQRGINIAFVSNNLHPTRCLGAGSTSPYEQNTARAHAAGAHARAHDLVESDLSLSTDDMRARMTIALDDQLHDHPEMAALFEQKLAIEGASPKPCIVPGNALQLMDDDPAASRSRFTSHSKRVAREVASCKSGAHDVFACRQQRVVTHDDSAMMPRWCAGVTCEPTCGGGREGAQTRKP